MKYRGNDGWIHKEGEEPQRYEKTESLNHDRPHRKQAIPSTKPDPCFYLFFFACAILLALTLAVLWG